MKTKHVSKLGVIFTILIFSLVSIGISYSGFIDTLHIQGTVNTAEDFTTLPGGTNQTAWARMHNDSNDFTYDFPGPNWATYIICLPSQTVQTFYLYAGQTYWVGELLVWKDANNLYVKYDFEENYYSMSEAQLQIATSLGGIPQHNGNPSPGQFDYKQTFDPTVSDYTFQISWNSNWNNIDLYIAAHGVVWGFYS